MKTIIWKANCVLRDHLQMVIGVAIVIVAVACTR